MSPSSTSGITWKLQVEANASYKTIFSILSQLERSYSDKDLEYYPCVLEDSLADGKSSEVESTTTEVDGIASQVDVNRIALRCLYLELSILKRSAIELCKVQLIHDNLFRWLVTLDGAKYTPYEGGKFILPVLLPISYTFDEPTV